MHARRRSRRLESADRVRAVPCDARRRHRLARTTPSAIRRRSRPTSASRRSNAVCSTPSHRRSARTRIACDLAEAGAMTAAVVGDRRSMTATMRLAAVGDGRAPAIGGRGRLVAAHGCPSTGRSIGWSPPTTAVRRGDRRSAARRAVEVDRAVVRLRASRLHGRHQTTRAVDADGTRHRPRTGWPPDRGTDVPRNARRAPAAAFAHGCTGLRTTLPRNRERCSWRPGLGQTVAMGVSGEPTMPGRRSGAR